METTVGIQDAEAVLSCKPDPLTLPGSWQSQRMTNRENWSPWLHNISLPSTAQLLEAKGKQEEVKFP